MSTPKIEVTLTEAESKALRDFCRKAFADRLTDDQRRMLVESFVEEETANSQTGGRIGDFRAQVTSLKIAADSALVSALKDALLEFCGRGW